MATYNYRSSKSVIGKILRDFGIQRSDMINDCIEWMGEALEHIGTAKQVVPKIRVVQAQDFKVRIPPDIYMLDTIRYANDNSTTQPDINDFKYILTTGKQDLHPGLFKQRKNTQLQTEENYTLDGRYIKTSFEDFWIAIQYKAFALDNDGYPLIPDDVAYQEALSWYCTMKILQRGEKHPVIDWQTARQEWQRYCTQARNASNMPDKNEYREFYKRWVTMIPNYDRDFEDFEDTIDAENVIQQSYSKNIIS